MLGRIWALYLNRITILNEETQPHLVNYWTVIYLDMRRTRSCSKTIVSTVYLSVCSSQSPSSIIWRKHSFNVKSLVHPASQHQGQIRPAHVPKIRELDFNESLNPSDYAIL